MGKYKQKRAATEFEGDAGAIAGDALDEASMARRSFLSRIGRWSAALGVVGLGTETWMQAVSRRSIMSSAVAAGAPRNRQLHPFPSDDTYNMPLGVNVWYAPTSDPATSQVLGKGGGTNVDNGWSHPIFITSTSDTLHTFSFSPLRPNQRIESYIASEDRQVFLQEHLDSQIDKDSPTNDFGWADGHVHFVRDNDLVETYVFKRESPTEVTAYRIVRNRLDRYSHVGGSNPLKNRAGVRAWGGSGIAGLIRKHEIEGANPHIPHALAVALQRSFVEDAVSVHQLGRSGHGDPGSPLYNTEFMFPANMRDNHGYPGGNGSCRMGMRFALDPAWATDFRINSWSNPQHRAIARALRDYGMIAADGGRVGPTLYGEPGVSRATANNMKDWGFMTHHLRRIAGNVNGAVVHNPNESHWDIWRNNGEGWGGGAPRVPYSPPLSGNLPSTPPEAPQNMEVTGARTFEGTG